MKDLTVGFNGCRIYYPVFCFQCNYFLLSCYVLRLKVLVLLIYLYDFGFMLTNCLYFFSNLIYISPRYIF